MDSLPRKVVGMSNSDYHSQNDFDSRSFIWSVYRYGGAAQKHMDEGHSLFSGNSATSLGSDFDTLVMGLCEGNNTEGMLAVAPESVLGKDGRRAGNAYKEWEADALKQGKIPCNEEYRFKLVAMAESLLGCPPALRCVEETTETQVSVFFETNGHPVRVRPDGCTPGYWWDLKTTSSSWDQLYRSIFDYGYAMQEALYVRGAMALGLDWHRMPFVFVRSVPPFDCHTFWLPMDVVEEAGKQLDRTLELIRLRRLTGEYMPADHGEITELLIPQWARKQEEEVVL
jgi:hypothetical protein